MSDQIMSAELQRFKNDLGDLIVHGTPPDVLRTLNKRYFGRDAKSTQIHTPKQFFEAYAAAYGLQANQLGSIWGLRMEIADPANKTIAELQKEVGSHNDVALAYAIGRRNVGVTRDSTHLVLPHTTYKLVQPDSEDFRKNFTLAEEGH